MKSIFYILAILFSVSAFGQNNKTDKIYLNNGTELEVNITKVGVDAVEFTYPRETLKNEEKTSNIRTIVFSSGRIQQFNTATQIDSPQPLTGKTNAAAAYQPVKPNELAILPVAFYDKATGNLWEDQSKMAQNRIYDFFEDNPARIAPLQMQDTRNTNAFLRKNNIGYAELDETPVEELEKILGAEYLVLSKVSFEMKTQATMNQSTYKGTENKGNKQTGTTYSSSTVNENKSYDYVVVLEVYKGTQKIYNETRRPMLNTQDSWKDAMEYMLKRTPIYKRK